MRIAVLVKQIPAFTELTLGTDGRLERAGLDLEMNPYCRRAVAQAVALLAGPRGRATDQDGPDRVDPTGGGTDGGGTDGIGTDGGGTDGIVVLTLGPPSAEDVLREAVAWAVERNVAARGVLVSDPAFAGSDTLATARALAEAIRREGPFDLVLLGRNSVDADTGQVGPEIAELLDLPFATGARHLSVIDGRLTVRCEFDDGWVQLECALPAVVSTAERLIDPCKVEPAGRRAVDASLITTVTAADLGPGPWGQAGSPTVVGATRLLASERARHRLDGPVARQVRDAVALLAARGVFEPVPSNPASVGFERAEPLDAGTVGPAPAADAGATARDATSVARAATPSAGTTVAVLVEPDRPGVTAELLGAAAELAAGTGGRVVALVYGAAPGEVEERGTDDLASSVTPGVVGADHVVRFEHISVEEDVATAVSGWVDANPPWALLAPGTASGREILSRVAARSGAGLTGDAVALEVGPDGRLVAWKPAFGGQLVAAISSTSPVQMVTVRAGILSPLESRPDVPPTTERVAATRRGRVTILARTRDDDLDALADAAYVVGVGRGIAPESYPDLQPLLDRLGAELAATRKVTDAGWLPRARQVGITGRSIAPRLFVSIGASGAFNHMVGVRAAHSVLAINPDPGALVFEAADVGIVGDWSEVVPLLVEELEAVVGS